MIMKWKWGKRGLAAAVLSLALSPAFASSAVSAPSSTLEGDIKAEVKSLINERTAEGRKIAAVVRLFNQGAQIVRVPDYEVRAVTSDKVSYTLQASVDNPVTVLPKETVELSYMIPVRRTDEFTVANLTWVKMNKSVYPRTEQTKLTLPVTQNRVETKQWGTSFVLPSAPGITLAPIRLMKQTIPQGPAFLLTFQAANGSKSSEFIPAFIVEGRTDKRVYRASAMEQGTAKLEPGEKRAVHYMLVLDGQEKLQSLNILTAETFAETKQRIIVNHVGWVRIPVPDALNNNLKLDELDLLDRNAAIAFDSGNQLIQPEVEVSLAKLTRMSMPGQELTSVTAAFTLVNQGLEPMPKPAFAVQLVSSGGRQYLGVKQLPLLPAGINAPEDQTLEDTLNPNVKVELVFEFQLPASEIGEEMGIILADDKTLSPFRVPIASFRAQVQ